MTVEQDSTSVEATERETVCAGCEHPPDEDEELRPVVLNPRLESDDTPTLVVDRTQETIEFDPDDLQSFLDQYTDREVEVVADHVFLMHGGCIESLFGVDVEPVEDGVTVSERGESSEESSEEDSREIAGMSKLEVVGSWVGLIGVLVGGHQLAAGLIPTWLGLVTILAGVYLIIYVWPFNSSWGES